MNPNSREGSNHQARYGHLPTTLSEVEEEGRGQGVFSRYFLATIGQYGIMWAVISGLAQSAQLIVLGETAHMLSSIQTMFIRSCFLLPCVVFISWKASECYNWTDMLDNVLFGLNDAILMVITTITIVLSSTSNTVAIAYNEAIPSAIFACIILGETFDAIDFTFSLVNAIGLVLISKSRIDTSEDSQETTVLGLVMSFGCLLLGCMLPITPRRLAHRGREDPNLLTFMAGCCGLVMTSTYLAVTNSWMLPKTSHEIFMCFLLGFFTLLSFYAFTKALQTERALVVALGLTLCIPVTYCFDVIFGNQIFRWPTIAGVCLTVGSTIFFYVKSYFVTSS